jgi:HEAT repeat protein
LNEYVRARIELERRMLVCGVGPQAESLKFTTAHAAVLLVMLQEFDSPLAARLRTQAASWAGSFELKEAIPILRELILDEDDDLQTRLNAIPSYIGMMGDRACDVLDQLLNSDHPAIRTAVYAEALSDRRRKIAGLALARIKTESPQVYAAVLRRAPLLQERDSTNEAANL